MGLLDFLRRLLFGQANRPPADVAPSDSSSSESSQPSSAVASPSNQRRRRFQQLTARPPIHLDPLRYESSLVATSGERESVDRRPYRFAVSGPRAGQFLDLSQDGDQRWLDYYGLPALSTPEDLANWLQLPIGTLAWLTHRTEPGHRARTEHRSHYVRRWVPKRSGGWRLIEAPKPQLKRAQGLILTDILNQVPPHGTAHGFVSGRSILTNAAPHVQQRFLLKFDLENFYANVRYSRVVAIFRSLGYSREVAIWLARLTTAALPWDHKAPTTEVELRTYRSAHLPQGAATSPALANLSAFGLDVRLCGLARAYGMRYTRYADDLTFSGPGPTVPALREVIPLVERIVRSERFRVNGRKRRVIRNSQRQSVTGVVVNEKVNVSRADYDRLKAILHNCRNLGPASQNRHEISDFAAHLRGRIAHVMQLNASRGEKLLRLFEQIDWTR